jgi:outer membrane protein OmpA-like peptidoglycan-associated protein
MWHLLCLFCDTMQKSITRVALYILSVFIIVSSFTACHSVNKTQKGAAIGAGTGGIIGAFIGKSAGNTALGAIIGGAVGGTAGAFIGRNMDRQAAEIKQTVPGATVVREGEGIIVKFDSGILFDVDKTDIKPAAQTNLQNLAASLQKNPQTNIFIIGHTDDTGTPDHNVDLSLRRAVSVKEYLTSVGINAARLNPQGKGESEPSVDNGTTDGRAQNRRVEIVILANAKMKDQATQGEK